VATRAVLLEDGTEIDDDYINMLETNTTVLLLQQNEQWTENGK